MSVGEISRKSVSQEEVTWRIDNYFALPRDSFVNSPEFPFAGVSWQLMLNLDQSGGFTLMLDRKGAYRSSQIIEYCLELKFPYGATYTSTRRLLTLEEYWTDCVFQKEGNILHSAGIVTMVKRLVPRLTAICYLTLIEEAGVETSSQTEPLAEGATDVELTSLTGPLPEEASGAQTSSPSNPSVDKVLQDFGKLLLSGDGSDVTLKVKGKELRAHRLILGARTPVFASMFRHQMAESSTGLVSIDDCEADIFKEFLHFVYSGSVQNMSSETVFGLHTLADKYQLDELRAECSTFMRNTLSVDSFCDAVTVAARHRETDLLTLSIDFFCLNMNEIIRTVKWQVFLRENPTEANELLIKALGTPKVKDNLSADS